MKKIALALGFALALAYAGQASAQSAPPAPDASVAMNNCAPAQQSFVNDRYVGCNTPVAQPLPAGIPGALMVAGASRDGGPQFISGAQAVQLLGTGGAMELVDANAKACRNIESRQNWHRIWSFVRPIITIAGIAYGGSAFGSDYATLLAFSAVTGEVNSRIWDGDMRDHRTIMLTYCRAFNRWETSVGESLMDAPPAQ